MLWVWIIILKFALVNYMVIFPQIHAASSLHFALQQQFCLWKCIVDIRRIARLVRATAAEDQEEVSEAQFQWNWTVGKRPGDFLFTALCHMISYYNTNYMKKKKNHMNMQVFLNNIVILVWISLFP